MHDVGRDVKWNGGCLVRNGELAMKVKVISVSSGTQDDESLKNKNKKAAESTEESTCCWDLQVWDLKTIP